MSVCPSKQFVFLHLVFKISPQTSKLKRLVQNVFRCSSHAVTLNTAVCAAYLCVIPSEEEDQMKTFSLWLATPTTTQRGDLMMMMTIPP